VGMPVEVGTHSVVRGEDAEWAELGPALGRLPSRCAQFLLAYREEMTIKGAAKSLGMDPTNHYNWRKKVAGYEELYQEIDRQVSDELEGLAVERTVHGLKETRHDAKGELRETRIRHDPSLLKMVLGARLPERYGKEGGAETINIVIQQVNE